MIALEVLLCVHMFIKALAPVLYELGFGLLEKGSYNYPLQSYLRFVYLSPTFSEGEYLNIKSDNKRHYK